MNEQPTPTPDDDVEGHMPRVRFTPGHEVEDVEGHMPYRYKGPGAGSSQPEAATDREDDVEGHAARFKG